MSPSSNHFSLTRNRRWWLIGLLLISTFLYVAGVAIEHSSSSEVAETAVTQSAPGEGQPGHSEAAESQTNSAPATTAPAVSQESLFGVDLENPWFVAAAVLGAIVLIGALLRFERPALFLIIAFSIVATLLDILEVVTQVNRANTGIAIVALLVAIGHITLGIVSVLTLTHYRASQPRSESGSAIA